MPDIPDRYPDAGDVFDAFDTVVELPSDFTVVPNHGAGVDALIGRLDGLARIRAAKARAYQAMREYEEAVAAYERDRGER
jgi:hypothetical protein